MNKALNDFNMIAKFYDELVDWAPYELWVNSLLQDLERFGLEKGDKILDLACGSGLSTIPMAENGYNVTGVDISEAMLTRANEKLNSTAGLKIIFEKKDLLHLNYDELFDAAVCMHSGLDYILNLDDLQVAFDNVRQILRPGGLFAFDKCIDEPNFYKSPQSDRRSIHNGEAIFEYSWDKKKKIFKQDCLIRFDTEIGVKKETRMIQKMLAVPLEKLLDMVEKAGFKTIRPTQIFTVADPGMGIFRAV